MTHLPILFLATFAAAFVATLPPGLLNMNAAKTSVDKGKYLGVVFSLGVCTTVLAQAFLAVNISRYLFQNPNLFDWLINGAIVVFAFLSIFFFLKARKADQSIPTFKISKTDSFFKGMFLASINLLTIPYYSGLNAMWKNAGWLEFKWIDTVVFMVSGAAGTFAVLYIYVFYFNKMDVKKGWFSKNSNYVLSGLMLVLTVVTVIRKFNS